MVAIIEGLCGLRGGVALSQGDLKYRVLCTMNAGEGGGGLAVGGLFIGKVAFSSGAVIHRGGGGSLCLC